MKPLLMKLRTGSLLSCWAGALSSLPIPACCCPWPHQAPTKHETPLLPFVAVLCGAPVCPQKSWARVLALVYATHAATTLIPVLSESAMGVGKGPHAPKLLAMYLPYLIVPLMMVARYSLAGMPGETKQAGKAKRQ